MNPNYNCKQQFFAAGLLTILIFTCNHLHFWTTHCNTERWPTNYNFFAQSICSQPVLLDSPSVFQTFQFNWICTWYNNTQLLLSWYEAKQDFETNHTLCKTYFYYHHALNGHVICIWYSGVLIHRYRHRYFVIRTMCPSSTVFICINRVVNIWCALSWCFKLHSRLWDVQTSSPSLWGDANTLRV